MKRLSKPGARWLAGALALVTAVAFSAPPVAAAEGTVEIQTPTSAPAEKPTLMAMADAKVQASDPADAVAPAQMNEMDSDKSFIKSPQGIAAVALLIGGTILYAYSRKNDRPTSPVR